MTERRYDEAEAAAIFKRAAESQQQGSQSQLTTREGMTLAELQEIGREVGLAPDLVQDAARAIDQGGRPTSRSFLGLPIGVGRTVNLDRKLSDEEWERLVVDLRETFDARGRLKDEGSFRQWTNGNLQALLEPTPTGHRVRMRTVKGDAVSLIMGGIAMLGIAGVAIIAAALRGGDVAQMGTLAAIGVGLFGLGALRLPGWARLRRKQMEEVAARIAAVASSPPSLESGLKR